MHLCTYAQLQVSQKQGQKAMEMQKYYAEFYVSKSYQSRYVVLLLQPERSLCTKLATSGNIGLDQALELL